jgi:predicted Zn-dependent peptidase
VDVLQGGAADHRDPNLFVIGARVKDERRISEVQEAIEKTLEDVKNSPVDGVRLESIKSHVRYAFQMRMDSPDAVAAALAHIVQLTGDPNAYDELHATYDSLTPGDLQETALKYFRRENRTRVVLAHQPGEQQEAKE